MAGPRRSREEGWKVEEEEAYYQVDDEESPWGPWGTHGQEGNGVGCARGVRRGESPGNVPGHTGPFLRDELVKFIESVKLGENRLSPLSLSLTLSLGSHLLRLRPSWIDLRNAAAPLRISKFEGGKEGRSIKRSSAEPVRSRLGI